MTPQQSTGGRKGGRMHWLTPEQLRDQGGAPKRAAIWAICVP